jgi:hypothetical protein
MIGVWTLPTQLSGMMQLARRNEVPNDLGISALNLAIPALSLARIDSIARRHGLTHSTLFVEASMAIREEGESYPMVRPFSTLATR